MKTNNNAIALLKELQNRLKVANGKSPLLNAITNSKLKLDIAALDTINEGLSNTLFQHLLTKNTFKIEVSPQNSSKEYPQGTINKISHILTEKQAYESETGVNTLGVGFPLIIKRSEEDNKLIVAPLFIWTINLKNGRKINSFELIRDEDDYVYFNDILKNFIYNENDFTIDFNLDDYLDEGVLNSDNLAQATYEILEQINSSFSPDSLENIKQQLKNIQTAEEFEQKAGLIDNKTDAVVSFSGIISLFNIQKQSIIEDYDVLLKQGGVSLEDREEVNFQSITSIPTDPSQQNVLEAISNHSSILIQGPPGTGKTQTLLAILVNALENDLKTIVVCEKRTAIDVLADAIQRIGLEEFFITIRQTDRDRRAVVDKVRFLLEQTTYNPDFNANSFEKALNNVEDIIKKINNGHKLLSEKISGDKTWSTIVAEYLEAHDVEDLNLDGVPFSFENDEYEKILSVIELVEGKHKIFNQYNYTSFINPNFFKGENPYKLEDKLKKELLFCKSSIKAIDAIVKEEFISIDEINFSEIDSPLTGIISLFSSKKKEKIISLKKLKNKIEDLRIFVKSVDWFEIDLEASEMVFLNKLKDFCNSSDIFFTKENAFIDEFEYQKVTNSIGVIEKIVVENLKNVSTSWLPVFTKSYYEQLLLAKANTNILKDESVYDLYNKSKEKFDIEQINYIKGLLRNRRAESITNFNNTHKGISIENLYNKRKSKKYKRLSLKEIVQYDTDFFLDFFPVVFVTPVTASNLFQGNKKYFDLLLFDEASQLRVEDTLPSLLKAKRVIVSGDKHQMPPSNYFTTVIEGVVNEYEEELVTEKPKENKVNLYAYEMLLSTESLLEFSSEMKFKNEYLDFHYRSNHPLLIEFSNHAFYGGRLLPLPPKKDYNPIQYINVSGFYSKSRTNEAEALKVIEVLKGVKENEKGSFPTIGIATFNAPQRDLIIKKFQEAIISGKEEFAHFATLLKEGLFIKNLENIQGEERDIIIISTTFGNDEDERFKQAFGALNMSKGYKLLNVMITRAKEHVIVCTSFPEEKIANYKLELEQLGSNNKRAVLYAYLAYAKAVYECNVPEVQAILQALNKNTQQFSHQNNQVNTPHKFINYIYDKKSEETELENVSKNNKLGGFKTDVQYVKEGKSIVIDCDGTPFKSSKLAYLHDVHTRAILTSLGYDYFYEWSFNWWRKRSKKVKL